MNKRYWNKWTEEEEKTFQNALRKYGNDFEAISDLMETRSYRQVRSHYYNSKVKPMKPRSAGNTQLTLICYDYI
ncbi:SANT/Myb_domain [Hexamita inflata]|uniref:SANT/Myb domain n=1 Tax=Hexamita inflata TaxID=28002 RepID=A0AA86U1Z8_9EUKA|nr:SANT/Myb domain [Hexamita inflata]